MSKESEALERLYCAGDLKLDYVCSDRHKEDYNTIESALKRLETLEEDFVGLTEINRELVRERVGNLNKLKALRILKENKITSLKLEWDGEWWTIVTPICPNPVAYGRSREEYELLKEAFL